MTDCTVTIAGETLVLMPERAVYWARTATLFITDTHFGKAGAFRVHGVPVPGDATADDLARLTGALERTGAQRLVHLGDFFHASAGRTPALLAKLAAWRTRWSALDVLLVLGNHDLNGRVPPDALHIPTVTAPYPLAPFILYHMPLTDPDDYVLCGHLHPATRVGRGRAAVELPCFWFGSRVGVLPAFGSFTGVARCMPDPGDTMCVIADDSVIPI